MVVSQKMVTLVYLEQLVIEEERYEVKPKMRKEVEELLVQRYLVVSHFDLYYWELQVQ